MKNTVKTEFLPRLFGTLGVAGCMVRMSLYHFCVDEKGLVDLWSPLGFALLALALGAAAGAVLLGRREIPQTMVLPRWAFSVSAWVLGVGVFAAVLDLETVTLLGKLAFFAGLLATAGQLWAGVNCLLGKKPHFLSHFCLSLFFALLLVAHYPKWSGDPQMTDYLFFAFALILLAWRAFDLAAREAGLEKRKLAGATGLLAVFFCLAGADWGHMLLLLSGAVWAEVNLYHMEEKED